MITFASSGEQLEFGGLGVELDGDPEFTTELEHKGESMTVRLNLENGGDDRSSGSRPPCWSVTA